MKKTYTASFTAQLVLDVLKETTTLHQISAEYGGAPTVVREWNQAVIAGLADVFEQRDSVTALRTAHEQQVAELYAEIGRLTTHVHFLKKTSPAASGIPPCEKRSCVPLAARGVRFSKWPPYSKSKTSQRIGVRSTQV